MIRIATRPAARGALSDGERRTLARRAERMIKAAALTDPTLGDPEVGLTLVDDAEIHQLNRDYRKKNKPTDVLAFAMREGVGGDLHPGILGDVIISVETARRQARRRGVAAEIEFLWAHGLCHLLGYDHQTDRQEREMNARMAALLAEGQRSGRVRAA